LPSKNHQRNRILFNFSNFTKVTIFEFKKKFTLKNDKTFSQKNSQISFFPKLKKKRQKISPEKEDKKPEKVG
jgi:hypothetical protein